MNAGLQKFPTMSTASQYDESFDTRTKSCLGLGQHIESTVDVDVDKSARLGDIAQSCHLEMIRKLPSDP
jgi:hypothetical protein